MTKLKAALIALLLLTACAQIPTQVQPNPELVCAAEPDRGMGGTGILSQNDPDRGPDRGMGGTGVIARDVSPGNGLGGSGMTASVDRGIGGTGIVGTVTGFGSICVNGFKIAYDQATPVTADGNAVPAASLARGMTVAVTAAEQAGALVAQTIAIQSALIGPVTAVGPDSIAVMGREIERDDGPAAAALKPGDVVAVSGVQQADGGLLATRIEAIASTRAALVRGYVTGVTDTGMTVGGVNVVGAAAVASVGQWAVAEGAWNGAALAAASIKLGPELALAPGARFSVEGFLVPQRDGGYVVRGMRVQVNARAGLDAPTIARLSGATRLQVIGNVARDQSIVPATVVVPEQLQPLRQFQPQVPASTPPPAREGAAAVPDAATVRAVLQELRGTYGQRVGRVLTPAEVRAAIQRRTAEPPVTPPERPQVPTRTTIPERPVTPVRPNLPVERPTTPTRPTRPAG